jgi:hypothetical protein
VWLQDLASSSPAPEKSIDRDPSSATGGGKIDIALERRESDGRANALETLGQCNTEEMKKALMDLHSIVEISRGNRPD